MITDLSIFQDAALAQIQIWGQPVRLHRGATVVTVRAIVQEFVNNEIVEGQSIDSERGTVSFAKSHLNSVAPTNKDWIELADGRKFYLRNTDAPSSGMFTCGLHTSPPAV